MIHVTGGVITRRGKVLVMRRAPGRSMAGMWEFPGGKMEAGETPAVCLARELDEELGIQARIGELLWTGEHAYPDRTIRMYFLRVDGYHGRIRLQDHDARQWLNPDDLVSLDGLLPADLPFAQYLRDHSRRPAAGQCVTGT